MMILNHYLSTSTPIQHPTHQQVDSKPMHQHSSSNKDELIHNNDLNGGDQFGLSQKQTTNRDKPANDQDGNDGDRAQAFLSTPFVDINNPENRDRQQYPDGDDSFWTRSSTHEIAWTKSNQPFRSCTCIFFVGFES
jgi:hypothetical protein